MKLITDLCNVNMQRNVKSPLANIDSRAATPAILIAKAICYNFTNNTEVNVIIFFRLIKANKYCFIHVY